VRPVACTGCSKRSIARVLWLPSSTRRAEKASLAAVDANACCSPATSRLDAASAGNTNCSAGTPLAAILKLRSVASTCSAAPRSDSVNRPAACSSRIGSATCAGRSSSTVAALAASVERTASDEPNPISVWPDSSSRVSTTAASPPSTTARSST